MSNDFLNISINELQEINGGSAEGWGYICTGVGITLAATVILATTPAIGLGTAVCASVAYVAGKVTTAFGLAEVTGATKY